MIEEALRQQIEPVAERRRHLSLAWQLSYYWLTAGLLGLVLIGVHRVWGWQSPLAVGLLCATVVAATMWALYRSRRRRPDYQAIARNIEQQHPDLKALLLAAIEQRPEGPDGRWGYLQRQVIAEAVVHATGHDWLQSVPPGRLLLANVARVGALSLLLFTLLLAWPGARSGAPASAGLLSHGYNVTVTPGDTEVEQGSPVVILARFEGRLPSDVSLVYGPTGQEPQRIPLTKSLDDPVFGGMVQEVSGDLVYRIEYAGRRTRDYTISVFQNPELVKADAKIVYPAYTKLPEKVVEDTRQISVVEGSEVTLTFTLNKPVATARLAPKTGIAPGLTIDSEHPNVLITSLTATESQHYELHLADARGRSNKLPPRFVIDVQKNQPPVLTPVFPNNDVVVSPLEELTLEAKVADDYGLVGYGLTYSLAGSESEDVKLSAEDTASREPQIQYLLALESLNAEPDQLLTYHFWADDIGPDGQPRRTASDIYFAEVRPFEEIFRESQSFQDQQNQEGGQQNRQGDQLARLQKQIITATWNIQQQAARSGGIENHKEDLDVVRQSQADVLQQARESLSQAEDPTAAKSLEAAAGHMETSVKHLTQASDTAATSELTPALKAEQSAYQELLKLRQREHQVAQGRNAGRSNNANSERFQQQLQQLELTQRENRYETQRMAQSRRQDSQRQDLQMLNRLRDLARRQNEMSNRLREAEAALRQAQDEQQRQEALRQLKRLRDEQLQALRDTDEVARQMENAQNRQRTADARQRLDDTRANIRESAEAMEQGMLSRAITSTTRAQRQLEQMREDLQRQTSSQFAEQMREMRDEAQQLDQEQERIAREMKEQMESRQRSLTGSDTSRELAERTDQQQESMKKLLDEMKNVSDQAEASEPLLSRKLYDTLRETSTGDTDQALEATGELLRRNLLPQAQQIERRAGEGIDRLRQGVEEAARNVLGDDAESLRLARQQLDELIQQANGQGQRTADGRRRTENEGQRPENGEQRTADSRQGTQNQEQNPENTAQQAQDGTAANPQSENRNPQSGRPSQARQGGAPREGGQPPRGSEGGREQANAGRRAGTRGGDGNDVTARAAREAGSPGPWDQAAARGPFNDEDYGPWSQRLRDVQEMLPERDLREEVARIWDDVRAIRADSKRHGKEPQWDVVQNQVLGPLVELRQHVSERLAQLASKEAMVAIDRDPVPDRYRELVRTYFENLGRGEP
ncbi:MAG: hypothetical protein MUC88_15435 [Planctomycetes bacterium]|jgi:hypothetical protein|nr:hypothetical protein [Planctomycetota bacterium]